jgi:glycolate oxidase
MPEPDEAVLARRSAIVAALRRIVPGEGVIDDPVALRPYESDGLTAYRQPPMVVVLPETTAQVSAVLRWCCAENVKVAPARVRNIALWWRSASGRCSAAGAFEVQ